jgi:CBS domain containing-hemolysin-like protein
VNEIVSDIDGSTYASLGIVAVLLLVFANGFFVAAEFSLVAVRRSRVAELVTQRRLNAVALQRALDHLDANLAATQLGITISSLALGWIGEPALAQLVEPLLTGLASEWSAVGAHAIAIAVAFAIITTLHIVLGELAPKSLALQRSETTALWIVRPLGAFRVVLWPAIFLLNGLGNLLLRFAGLRAGTGEETQHSREELKMLVKASGRAGLLHEVQQQAAERILNIGQRSVGDFMTPRTEVAWVDADNSREEILQKVRECRHERIVVSRGTIDQIVGIVAKQDLLDQSLDGKPLDPLVLVKEALILHDGAPLLNAFEQFKRYSIGMAVVVDEYGSLAGIVTQTDLLKAIVGELEGEHPKLVVRDDGSLLIDGDLQADEAFDRLQIQERPRRGRFHTLAGFALFQLGRIPQAGDNFVWEDWRFEIASMDGRRIERLLASRNG